jgi:putative nucleotidyltransferase with HDIG domain
MKILIVDDEKISRKILVKKMEALGECMAVDNSRKALVEFETAAKKGAPFDLITLDVSMPGMDGKQVLQYIRKKELAQKIPRADRVKVIMVTSRMNIANIKACINLGCNGYLSKPVSRYQLLQNLGKMGFDITEALMETDKDTHAGIVAQIIQQFYKGKIALPVFPSIVREIQELLQGDSPSMEDLARIVEKEIVISSKMISIANSPLYKGVDAVDNLNAALLRLGMKATQGVISAVAARNIFDSKSKSLKKVLEKLWMHSFATACLGKEIGLALGLENTENIFLMGIIHDIGKMLLLKAIADIFPDKSIEDSELHVAIHEIHTTFGAVLLKKMRFSKAFIQIAEFHHWNSYSKETEPELMIINLADHLAYKIGFGFLDDKTREETREEMVGHISSLSSFKQLGLDPDKVMEICDQVKAMVKESARAF